MVLLEDIKDFIRDLAKYRKNFRIYPSNNPIYISSIDNAHSKISSLLDTIGELPLNFKQHDIIFNGDIVYHNEEKYGNLAFFFFSEGIRKVTFKKGVPKDELEESMRILFCDLKAETDDSDIATLLWEKGFKFIKFVFDNSFLLEDANYEIAAIESVKENSATDKDTLEAYQDASDIAKISSIDTDPLTDDDLNQILLKRENDPDEKSPKLVSIFLEMLLLVNETKEIKEIMGILRSLISYSVEKETLENIICNIKKINGALNDSDYNNKIQTYLEGIEKFIDSQEFIDHLGRAIENRSNKKDTILLELVGLFNIEAAPNLINTLCELNNISSRRIFIHILTELGKKDMFLFIKYISDNKYLSDSRWYLVRNVIHILRQIGDVSALEHIIRAVRYDHNKVRVEVISALGEMGSESELDILSKYISDPDDHVRIASIRAIGNIRTPDSKRIIFDEITGTAFKNKHLDEKIELLKALNKWKGENIINLLIKILDKTSFLDKERNDETRAAAAYILGLTGIKEVPRALSKLQNSKNLVLREKVLNSIKLITNNKIGG